MALILTWFNLGDNNNSSSLLERDSEPRSHTQSHATLGQWKPQPLSSLALAPAAYGASTPGPQVTIALMTGTSARLLPQIPWQLLVFSKVQWESLFEFPRATSANKKVHSLYSNSKWSSSSPWDSKTLEWCICMFALLKKG